MRGRSHITSHYTWESRMTALQDFRGVLGRPLDTFLLGSHNFMVTAVGSCVKWAWFSSLEPQPIVSQTQPVHLYLAAGSPRSKACWWWGWLYRATLLTWSGIWSPPPSLSFCYQLCRFLLTRTKSRVVAFSFFGVTAALLFPPKYISNQWNLIFRTICKWNGPCHLLLLFIKVDRSQVDGLLNQTPRFDCYAVFVRIKE